MVRCFRETGELFSIGKTENEAKNRKWGNYFGCQEVWSPVGKLLIYSN